MSDPMTTSDETRDRLAEIRARMSAELLARVRAQLFHAKEAGLTARTIAVEDLEALLVIAEQPALSFTAKWVEYPDGELNYGAAPCAGEDCDADVEPMTGECVHVRKTNERSCLRCGGPLIEATKGAYRGLLACADFCDQFGPRSVPLGGPA